MMGRMDGNASDVMPPETTEALKGRIAQLETEVQRLQAQCAAALEYGADRDREIQRLARANDQLQDERDKSQQGRRSRHDRDVIVDVIKYLASLL